VTIEEILLFFNPELDTSKINLLKQYVMAAQNTTSIAIRFSYSEPTDSNLARLRMMYSLDDVAGSGPEVQRITNVLHWVHGRIRHDGSTPREAPDPRNAINIIAVADRENWGMNCRMLATVLNECYLALGYPARHLTCLPYDAEDPDCHVVNMVWSDSLTKWLFMDPTYDAFFMNADSMILSPWEIREALARGDSLVLPQEINWNGQRENPVVYMNYMAKNLFRFQSPAVSEFGYESNPAPRHYVTLNPTLYDPTRQQTSASADSIAKGRIPNDFVTDDARHFFAPPPEQ
jgi:hypothetical protein